MTQLRCTGLRAMLGRWATFEEKRSRYTKQLMIRTYHKIPVERLRLLVFDLDGTLVDSQIDVVYAINATLRHFGRPELSTEVIAGYMGDGRSRVLRRALGDPDNEAFVREARDFFTAYYKQHTLDHTYAHKGIMQLLERLHAKGLKLAVLSNKPEDQSRRILNGLAMACFFGQVYGGNSFETKKPDPLGARMLLDEVGVRPDEALMIGDSQDDVLTARNCGMWSLSVTCGFSPQSLDIHPPDVLVGTTSEIAAALGFA